MIALDKEIFNKAKKEFLYLLIIFITFSILFKIIFFKENLIVILRVILSIFWMFAIPGYFILFYWHEKLEFAERLIMGIALSAAIIGIFSYYFGIMGLNIKYHIALLPLAMITASTLS